MQTSEINPKSMGAMFAAWAGYFTSPNVIIAPLVSLFMGPLSETFHMSRTEISLLALVAPWIVALVSPYSGRAVDRFGLRRVLIPALIAFGCAQFVMAGVQTTVQLIAATVVLSTLAGIHCAVGYTKLISLWFDRYRGMVLGGVVALGGGGGAIIMPHIVRYLIETYSWREAYIGLGIIVLLIGTPSLLVFMREPEGARTRAASKADSSTAPGLTLAEALRTKELWLMIAAIFMASLAILGTVAHAFPLLVEKDVSPATATTVLSFMFAGGIVGQFGAGVVADRWQSPKFGIPFFGIAAVGLSLVHTSTAPAILLFGALMQGLGKGGEASVLAYLCSRYFGLKAFGSIYALTFAASNFGIGVGIVAMGVVHDMAGSYAPMGPVMVMAGLVSVVCVFFLGPYRFSAQRPSAPAAQAAGPKQAPIAG